MVKWRCISGTGISLGMVVTTIDFLVEGIPYVMTIPLVIVSVILIYAGLIIRKRENMREK